MTDNRVIIEIHRRDGWLVAKMMLERPYELCRMVAPPRNASLRAELLDTFNTLASKIVESIMRDDQPDAEIVVRRINMPEAGHG